MPTKKLLQRRTFLTTSTGLALAGLTGCGGGGSAGGTNPSTTQPRTPLLIPAYFFDPELWSQVLPARNPVHSIIVNISNGPGTALDPNKSIWLTRFQLAQANGHKLLGYVDCAFTAKTAAAVQSEVALWNLLYGVQDIFLDQVSGKLSDLAYCAALINGIRAINPNARIILNVGGIPDVGYFQLDARTEVVVFENSWAFYQTVTFPAWLNSYWTRAHLMVHTAPLAALSSVYAFAGAHAAAGYFVTDQTTSSYTLNLPAYWADELRL